MRVPGGKAGNAAVAAARLLEPRQVGILGALGRDEIAERQIRLLSDEGVDTTAVSFKPETESGQAYILIEESGENEICTHFGANATLTATDVSNEHSREMVCSSKIVVISDPPEETAETIARIAREAERPVAWDPGVRAQAGMHRLERMLLDITYLFLNEVEVEYMTGVREPEMAADLLSRINPELVTILKFGADGCMMLKRGSVTRAQGIDLEECGMAVVNTVGCGDAFLGAFSAAKALQLGDEDALNWANWAGALKATKSETRGSPTIRELKTWVDRNRG
jgi:ribokinase